VPVWAQQTERPAIKVALSDDQSIITHRILHTALERSGCQMVSKVTGMRTAVADVNYGDAAILPLQTDGWELQYPNLIKVPVVVEHVEFTAYTRSEDAYQFSEWSGLKGLRLGCRWQNQYVVNNAPRAGASKLVTVNSLEELWDTLLNNEADVVVLPRMSHFENRFPKGIKRGGVIERQACYTYVNKDYAYLVPLLEKAYREMTRDGTLSLIKSGQQASGSKKTVLQINSYNTHVEWERTQIEAVRKIFDQYTEVEFRSLDLNTNELHNQASFNSVISDFIRTDFIDRNPDLIIASGNEALAFTLNNYYLLFPRVPVVFCGINDLDVSMLYGLEDYVTGICETVSFYETVAEMLRLYSGTRRIFILNDYIFTKSTKIREDIKKSIAASYWPVEFVFNEDKPFGEILEDIRSFEADTLVLIGHYIADSDKIFYSEIDVQELVSQASKSPVFCITTSYNGHGTLGGLVSAADVQGSITAAIAVDILEGKPPLEVPIIIDSASFNRWQFDYKAAKRFKININNLPVGHVVVNNVLPIWESNPFEFKLALAVAGLLVVIICGLIIFLSMLRTKNAHLLEMQSHLYSAEELLEKDNELRRMLENTAQKEKEANMLKSRFLANMSHEIRTPMNAIIGLSQLALVKEQIPENENFFHKINSSAKNLLSIINDILDFSKIEAEKLDLAEAEFELEDVISNAFMVAVDRIEEKPLEIILDMQANVPCRLCGDSTRLWQILKNLLDNAVKYSESGNVILSVNAAGAGGGSITLCFSVKDTGIGMSPDQLERLFTPFEQFHQKTFTTKRTGTGLGMSITKQLTELMGGEIKVTSQVGAGTEFCATLPFKLSSETKTIHDISVNYVKKTARQAEPLLLIGGYTESMRIMQGLLKDAGLSSVIAATAAEAAEMIESASGKAAYQAVIADCRTNEDGLLIAKRIKEACKRSVNKVPENEAAMNEVPRMLLATANMKQLLSKQQVNEAGIDGIIEKPFTVSVFMQKVCGITKEIPGDHGKNVKYSMAKVLLCEDNEINQLVASGILNEFGITPMIAANGQEALDLLEVNTFDLIFMDIIMPVMDGHETTIAIRQSDKEYRNTPICALTANVMVDEIQQCVSEGMNAHLEKPISFEAVTVVLADFLADFAD